MVEKRWKMRLGLLLWKNALIRIRHPVRTLAEDSIEKFDKRNLLNFIFTFCLFFNTI